MLYTDGLVERRTEPLDDGLERLLSAIRAHPDVTPPELVDALLEDGARGDDVCVLVFRRASAQPYAWSMPSATALISSRSSRTVSASCS